MAKGIITQISLHALTPLDENTQHATTINGEKRKGKGDNKNLEKKILLNPTAGINNHLFYRRHLLSRKRVCIEIPLEQVDARVSKVV